MKGFLRGVGKIRRGLGSKKYRKKFWRENERRFEKNVEGIIKKSKTPRKWKIYLVASSFLKEKNRRVMPYDYDSWSTTNLIAATKEQGFESMIFLNKARAGFLSLPALIPLIVHELEHVKQAARSPENYYKSLTDDLLSAKEEAEADRFVRHLPKEFREQTVIEDILYCYDTGGWKCARKMADFLYKKRDKIYGGGYDKEMTEEQYGAFLEAMKQGNIKLFLDFFR